jgi:hypothetical protein
MSNPSISVAMSLPDDFHWGESVGLLLDPRQVENLVKQLYEWSGAPEVYLLYQGTQWAEISRRSPLLVRLRDQDNAVLRQFLSNTQQLGGYLLVCDGTWDELLAHLRWLTSFRPPQDEEMFLRISDPAVIQALFAAEHYPGVELFGPFQRLVVANAPLVGWTQFERAGEKMIPEYDKPYTASEAQWRALQAVTFRKSIGELYLHMQRFFPEYRGDLDPAQRLEHIYQLAMSAVERGFKSEQEIWLYANVFGFLGDEALERHSDIRELLTASSKLTPLQRVDRAAAIAAERSAQ